MGFWDVPHLLVIKFNFNLEILNFNEIISNLKIHKQQLKEPKQLKVKISFVQYHT